MRILFIILIFFSLVSCDETGTSTCDSPADCIKSEECRFDTIDSEGGICTPRQACQKDSNCDDGRLCLPDETNFYCGSRRPINLNIALLDDALQYTPYSAQLILEGASAVHSFQVMSGKLPQGITLSLDGLISGTTTATPDFYTFKIRVLHGPTDATYFYNYRILETELSLHLKEKSLP